MKKHILIVLIILLAFCCTACAANTPVASPEGSSTAAEAVSSAQQQEDNRQENADKIIENTKAEMLQKGWQDVALGTTNETAQTLAYTITGQIAGLYHNPITITVSIVIDDASPKGRLTDVAYASLSGREMQSEGILPADDQDLWDCMYSY